MPTTNEGDSRSVQSATTEEVRLAMPQRPPSDLDQLIAEIRAMPAMPAMSVEYTTEARNLGELEYGKTIRTQGGYVLVVASIGTNVAYADQQIWEDEVAIWDTTGQGFIVQSSSTVTVNPGSGV